MPSCKWSEINHHKEVSRKSCDWTPVRTTRISCADDQKTSVWMIKKRICNPICFSIKFLIRNISWGKCWLCVWADWAPSLSGLSSPPVSASLFTEPFSLQTTVARASHPHTYLPTFEHPIILLRINSSSPRKVLQLHHIPFPTKLPSCVSNDPITWEIWSAENAFLLSLSLTKSYHEDSKQFLAPEIETEFALTIVL